MEIPITSDIMKNTVVRIEKIGELYVELMIAKISPIQNNIIATKTYFIFLPYDYTKIQRLC